MLNNVLVTGADGFIGQRLVNYHSSMFTVRAAVRKFKQRPTVKDVIQIGDVSGTSDWSVALEGINTVVHLAAIAHNKSNDKNYINEVNVKGAINLAEQAVASGVKRLIFISSVSVLGNDTVTPFNNFSEVCPLTYIAKCKCTVEHALLKISQKTDMEIVIIRPPLVYGPGVKANFAGLMKLSSLGIPLPLGGITQNLRSMVFIDNLVDLIVTCIEHPNAANKVFLVSDDEDLSTTSLLKLFSQSFGKSSFLIPIPASWLEFLGKITGKSAVIERLCGSLQLDISDTKNSLNWKPPISVKDGLLKTVQHFQQHK
jgi:UDP-glucose 4-epimerase